MEMINLNTNSSQNIGETVKTGNSQTSDCKRNSREPKCFSLNIYKDKSIQIYKPLLFLKLALFLWFAGATSARTFFTVFLKQRGLSISEISLIYIISPVLQILCTSLLGILADKIGKSKPILIGNILFTGGTALLLNLIAHTQQDDFQTESFSLECLESNMTVAKGKCWLEKYILKTKSCDVICPDYIKTFEVSNQFLVQINSSTFFNTSRHLNASCNYDVKNLSLSNSFLSICEDSRLSSCQVSCVTSILVKNQPAWVYIIISVLFFVSFVNVFRFFDITVMALSKEHNADYGVHRFFSICGNLVGPALSGYIVEFTTPAGGETFYEAAFYSYAVFCFLTVLVVFKVDVRGAEPGKHMWKKSVVLMRNPDAVFSGIVLMVLGTTWGFTVIFKYWYLEDLSAEAYHYGLIEVIHSLVGLPIFLAASRLIQKIGTTNVFVLALGSQALFCFGYSFLQAVWPALLLELSVSISLHLLWVAVMYFCRSISPPGLFASVNALAGSLHFALGRVLGSVIGGSIMNKFGGRSAFMVLGIVDVVTAVIYSAFLIIRLKYQRNKEIKR